MRLWTISRKIFTKLLATKPYFATKDVEIGHYVHFGKNVVFNCKRVRIGDGVIFHNNITINADIFEIGDYGTIYDYCFFPGPGTLRIGHNFWLGASSIVDSKGGAYIANNVGIGPHSQLWTHMIYGDVMAGCRFHSVKRLEIEDDVWLVGHCLVSPVKIGARSLAMLGSVITRDMKVDHCYAGVPTQDITERIGPQFKDNPVPKRVVYLQKRLAEFAHIHKEERIDDFVKIVTTPGQMPSVDGNIIVFNVADRTYTKHGTHLEHELIRFLLPDVKFIPADQGGHLNA